GTRGRRPAAADLRPEGAREIVPPLAAGADVFLGGFRPRVAARLGIAYEDVAGINPGIVYASISGFGQTGPESQRPAMDPILQAFTGLIATNRGPDGVPHRVIPIVVDMSTALYTFQALSAAIYARRDEPHGCYLDASLLQSAAALQVVHMMAHHLEGGRMRPGIVPGGSFAAADGFMFVVTMHEADFRHLCDALELPEVRDDPRFATSDLRYQHLAELMTQLSARFERYTTAELGRRLRAAGLMHSRVNHYLEFLRDPRAARGGHGHRALDRSTGRGSSADPASARSHGTATRIAPSDGALPRPASQGDPGRDRPGLELGAHTSASRSTMSETDEATDPA